MAKISKSVLKKHNEALELLKKDELNHWDKEFIFDHYHEGATNMNNLVSAHFTPRTLAVAMAQNTCHEDFVDLCAGIGVLAWYMVRDHEMGCYSDKPFTGICIELVPEFYEIGKKLVPECHWILGDIFDPEIIKEVKERMEGKSFSVISNPPYGNQCKTDTKSLLRYRKSNFEYKAIELGAILGAEYGTFLIPQDSCNFKFSGANQYQSKVLNLNECSNKYKDFVKDTGLEITPNNGWSTDINEDDHEGWKDVSITTEIANMDYEEWEYKPKISKISMPNSTIADRIHERAKTAKVPIPGGFKDPKNKPLLNNGVGEQLNLF